MSYSIIESSSPDEAYAQIWSSLLAFNQAAIGNAKGEPYALEIKNGSDAQIKGGLWAQSLWGSFYIALIVTPEDLRHNGIGSELMKRAEQEARIRGCHQMWLDTYAFQARPFYERLGFSVFGQLDGPPPMFPRYFMQKRLEPARAVHWIDESPRLLSKPIVANTPSIQR